MTKKNDTKTEAVKKPIERTAKRRFYFPTLNKSVEAESREEALKLVQEQKEEEGDANV